MLPVYPGASNTMCARINASSDDQLTEACAILLLPNFPQSVLDEIAIWSGLIAKILAARDGHYHLHILPGGSVDNSNIHLDTLTEAAI